jgi:hypothetical protein
MLNEEMHDRQRRILILTQVKTKITEGNLIVLAGLGVCAEQKTCELYRKRLQVDDIAPHPVPSLPPLEFPVSGPEADLCCHIRRPDIYLQP